jgi:hypothetical protein
MRSMPALAVVLLTATLSGCAAAPFVKNIPMWKGDAAKVDALGKGAALPAVDKALGMSRPLWTHTANVAGTPYQVRLYDWVEQPSGAGRSCFISCALQDQDRQDLLPYALIYTGAEPRLHAWGTLSALRESTDPAVLAMLPQLGAQYSMAKRLR